MTDIKGVLFDLDGTLLDSAPDLVGSMNHVRQSHGLERLPVDDYRRFVSHGAVGLLKAGMPETDHVTFENWRLAFLEHYSENCFVESRLFEGVRDLLAFLDQSKIPWGIVTNKVERFTQPIIAAAELNHLTSCVVCGDTIKQSKPDPAPVLLGCELISVNPKHVLFVGDDVRDLQAGLSAGTQTALVQYGYGVWDPDDSAVAKSFQIKGPTELIRLVSGG